jgi:preprotein translocase subunit SecG
MWPDMMFDAIDSGTEVNDGPVFNNKPAMALLYIMFIFITCFFVMNLFISVIVSKFNEEKAKSEGTAGLSEEQKEWVKIQRFLVECEPLTIPVEPTNSFRKFFFKVAISNPFELSVSVVIVLNTILLCMDYND